MVLSSPGTCPEADERRRLPSSFVDDPPPTWRTRDDPEVNGCRGRSDPQTSNEKLAKQGSPCKRASDDHVLPSARGVGPAAQNLRFLSENVRGTWLSNTSGMKPQFPVITHNKEEFPPDAEQGETTKKIEVEGSSKHDADAGDEEGAQGGLTKTRRRGLASLRPSRGVMKPRARRFKRLRIGDESEEETADVPPAAAGGSRDHCRTKDNRPTSPLSFLEAVRLVSKKSAEQDVWVKDILDVAIAKGLTFGRPIR